jgi:amino-acid N-acetyltransferase
MAILAAQATKRDAKSYFGKFGLDIKDQPSSKSLVSPNLSLKSSAPIRTALIKLCHADTLPSHEVLPGIARTLIQLGRLGMPVCIIVEPEDTYHAIEPLPLSNALRIREKYGNLVYRIADAIEAQGGRAQPLLGEVLTRDESPTDQPQHLDRPFEFVADVEQGIRAQSIAFPESSKTLLHNLLQRGQIPVVAPVVGGTKPSLSPVSADSALFRICEGLSTSDNKTSSKLSVERVIIVDPVGGLPANERREGSHVYINLQQEYDHMVQDLSRQLLSINDISSVLTTKLHLRNLIVMKMCLELVNPTSSALITTPTVAAARPSQSVPQSLIHNLLTDKPLISPSLPARRSRTPTSTTTLLRLGLPVSVYRPEDIDSENTTLDFARLVKLIEDSFGRQLDVNHYRNRIHDKTAVIIIAGDYEGAAVVTKEVAGNSSSGEWVPYLDKFAVSRKSQGSGGVADIVFNVLVSLFPDDLIWRSRKTNPVNKWVLSPLDDDTEVSISRGREGLGSCLGRNGVCFGLRGQLNPRNLTNMSILRVAYKHHGNDAPEFLILCNTLDQ